MPTLILSPHFDDAPLSLGQSLIDGELAGTRPVVGVVFGRSNWQRWFHPTRRRTPLVSMIRRAEERLNARRFGYSVKVGGLEEVILRTGQTDSAVFLDPDVPVPDDLVAAVVDVISGWRSPGQLVLAPLGVGGHLDHRIVTAAAQRIVPSEHLGFYEDRPYASFLTDDQITARATQVDPLLRPRHASASIGSDKTGRIFYPSQFDRYFLDAIAIDATSRRTERLWSRPGS